MASDTGTLDLERVHAERRRLEEGQMPLGPDDQPAADELTTDLDPATRAAQIVQEVLAAAERRRDGSARDRARDSSPSPDPADGTAAARARRIVEEVLASASAASDEHTVTVDGTDDDDRPPLVRADLVLLTAAEPLVLLPGEAYDPEDGAYVPDGLPRPLGAMVERVLDPAAFDTAPGTAHGAADADELVTPTTITEAIRGAGESSNRHGVRWIVAGAVWALAFALVGPLAYKALISSADMTIDLWDADTTVAEQEVEVPEDELPPADEGSAEVEIGG